MPRDPGPAVLRPLVWLGDSRKNIRAFPVAVQKLIGDELQLIQFGGMPNDAKPFRGVGSGVIELALRHDTNAYRSIVAVQLGQRIYVLHAFQKKAKSGSKTPRRDIEMIELRYKEAKELARHENDEG